MMDFGLAFALENFGIFSVFTIVVIAFLMYEKKQEKKRKESMGWKADDNEYKTAV